MKSHIFSKCKYLCGAQDVKMFARKNGKELIVYTIFIEEL